VRFESYLDVAIRSRGLY